ncbi:hypothetical protein RiCNE_08120 [Rickettsia endosymbiont of Culicoides newsteadi]|nr:hypothetical protein RiCNE_08120 [Rickettsia endosymbiont of Culicoides newsteadi]
MSEFTTWTNKISNIICPTNYLKTTSKYIKNKGIKDYVVSICLCYEWFK